MIRSPADYMAEWENVPLDPTTDKKKKKKTTCKPRTASAYGRAVKKKKKQRENLEPPRPMATRLKKKQTKTAGKPRTASAYSRAVKKNNNKIKKTACKPRTASAYGRAVNNSFWCIEETRQSTQRREDLAIDADDYFALMGERAEALTAVTFYINIASNSIYRTGSPRRSSKCSRLPCILARVSGIQVSVTGHAYFQ